MSEFSNHGDDPRAANAMTVGPRDDYRALQKENERLCAECERLEILMSVDSLRFSINHKKHEEEVERLRAREQAMREALTREMQFAAHMTGCATLRKHPTLCTCGFARMRNASYAALAPDAGSTPSNEVERLRKANAAMRSAISAVDLVLAGASTMPLAEARRILNESLVHGIDAHGLTHEQVQPLVRALTYCCGANDSRSRATAHKALTYARTLGFK